MKIFRSEQIREIDDYTIRYEPVASADLMERAAGQLYAWIAARFGRSHRFVILAGPGNNGGDGLALARMLILNRYDVKVFHVKFTDRNSSDWEINRARLEKVTGQPLEVISSMDQFPVTGDDDIVIDAIFGTGLNRPADGVPAMIIAGVNKIRGLKISVDIPSGLYGEDNAANRADSIVRAAHTLTFQFPRLAFMFPENAPYAGEWTVLPIGLHPDAIRNTATPYRYLETDDIRPLLKIRNKFDHKGNYGHGLLAAGSPGKLGAAILGAGAALRTGIGLLTCHVPASAAPVIHSAVPETMVAADPDPLVITDTGSTDPYSAVGAGPGFGTAPETQKALLRLMEGCRKPMVIDADALNILALNKDWYAYLNDSIILTPHPREFERLAGKSQGGYARLRQQMDFSREHNCIVVLKGAHTSVTTPDGSVFFNSTGNPGMATAGSGDVLTGILLSLLAQGYSPVNAAITGVFLHGLAGDIAAGESCYESLIATDIINSIGKAFNRIRET